MGVTDGLVGVTDGLAGVTVMRLSGGDRWISGCDGYMSPLI